MSQLPSDSGPRIITRDILCRSCHYNLRGLSPDGLCPECASPILDSLRSDLLVYADPAWLHRLTQGALTLAIGTFLLLVFAPINLVLLVGSGGGGLAVPISLSALIIAVAGALTIFFGTLLFTTPEAGNVGRAPATARRAARICIPLTFLLPFVLLAPPVPLEPVLTQLWFAWLLAQIVITSISFASLFFYAASLARRASAFPLRDACRIIAGIIVLAGAALCLMFTLDEMDRLDLMPFPLLLILSFAIIVNPAIVIAFLRLRIKLRSALRDAGRIPAPALPL